MSTASRASSISGDVTLRDLVAILKQRRVLFAVTIVACTVLAAMAAIVATPVYRTEVKLFPVQQDQSGLGLSLGGGIGGIAALAGLKPANQQQSELAIATMQSKEFVGKFIRDHDLVPILLPPPGGISKLLSFGKTPKPPTVDDAVKVFLKRIQRVDVDAETGAVTLTIEFKDRQKVADWTNGLVAQINEQMRQRTIAQARSRLDFLYGELKKTNVLGVQQAIFNLIESETKNIMVANTERDFAFRAVETVLPPQKHDFVRPQRRLMVFGGALAGVLLSLVFAVVLAATQGRGYGKDAP